MQDIAVGVAKLKEQMSNPMFLASKEKTHTHRFWARERGRLEASYSMSSVRE